MGLGLGLGLGLGVGVRVGAEGHLVGRGEEHRHDGARVRPRQLGGEGGGAAERVLEVAQPRVGVGLGLGLGLGLRIRLGMGWGWG